jgi:diguanylate cyclase (GGDEF)-like protein
MMINGELTRSILGRRMLAQFAGAALLPIAALAILFYVKVTTALLDSGDRELAGSAHSYALAVQNRAALVDALLRLAARPGANGRDVRDALVARIGTELDGVARIGADGQVFAHDGELGKLPEIDRVVRGELEAGRTAIVVGEREERQVANRIIGADVRRVVLLRRVGDGADSELIATAISPDYLAGERSPNPDRTRFALAIGGRIVLGAEDRSAEDRLTQIVASASPANGRISAARWQSGSVAMRSVAATLVTDPLAAATPWSVVASMPESYALAPTRAFQFQFAWVAAVAVLIVVALGARQTARIVTQLHQLLAGTRRVARQDFTTEIKFEGHDEMAQLSGAFNDMSRGIGRNFATLNVLSQIDQTILTKLDVGEVVKNALRCVRYVTGVDVVVLGLFETEAADSMRIYLLRSGGRNRIERTKIGLPSEVRMRIPAKSEPHWLEEPPLPADFVAKLRSGDRVTQFWPQPISRGDRVWGVMVLAHGEATALSSDQQGLLSGVTDRLVVAFSTVERDRKLHTMAHVDALTGLPNRASMLALLTQELAHAHRSKLNVGVLFLDLDRFKQTNDTLGHAVGDLLLQHASERIKRNVREGDTVARLGGDEFTVVLGNLASMRDAGNVARQLIKSLSRPFEIEGHTIYVGASVGIAIYPDDGSDGADLLKKADTAMYRAKDEGRNRFAYYEEKMNVEARRRAALDRELRQALERSEFVLNYQPQIDLATGRVCAVEALVRWQHPEQGLLYPGAFIPFAEESGLIPEIGTWIMREACLQHQRWREAGIPIPRVAVNVSIAQLRRSNFVRNVHFLLSLAQMPPGSLEIEVTESMFLEGGKAATDALHALVKAGVHVSIDDFGTGYSSFGYLKTLPASILKLDKSFLVDATTDNDAGMIIAAMINLAHTLRKEVVAEGVEREDQLEFLRRLGCEKVQGYLFSRPLPPSEAAAYAVRRRGAAELEARQAAMFDPLAALVFERSPLAEAAAPDEATVDEATADEAMADATGSDDLTSDPAASKAAAEQVAEIMAAAAAGPGEPAEGTADVVVVEAVADSGGTAVDDVTDPEAAGQGEAESAAIGT